MLCRTKPLILPTFVHKAIPKLGKGDGITFTVQQRRLQRGVANKLGFCSSSMVVVEGAHWVFFTTTTEMNTTQTGFSYRSRA